jgi:hypothetical protein
MRAAALSVGTMTTARSQNERRAQRRDPRNGGRLVQRRVIDPHRIARVQPGDLEGQQPHRQQCGKDQHQRTALAGRDRRQGRCEKEAQRQPARIRDGKRNHDHPGRSLADWLAGVGEDNGRRLSGHGR